MKLRKMCFKRKKLICLFFIMSLFLIFNISNVKADNIHYNYTFESADLDLEPKFNRTSNLRPKQEFHEGVFDAEFSFTGLLGTNIDDLDSFDTIHRDINCDANIQDLGTYKEVLKINDYNSSGYIKISHNFISYNNSVVSFWFRSNDVSQSFYFILLSNSTTKIMVRVLNSYLQYKNLLNNWITIPYSDIVNDIWIHVKMVMNCSSDLFDFYLDGSLFGNDLEFNEVSDSLNNLTFSTEVPHVSINYIDAIDIINGTIYNHSNVGILKTDTNLFEVDKYAFHQDDIDSRLPKSGSFIDGTLGWNVVGNMIWYHGAFENPETHIVDDNNGFPYMYDTVAPNSIYMQRDFGAFPKGDIEFHFEFSPWQFPQPTTFGMYILDSNLDTIFSVVCANTDGTLRYCISNGIDVPEVIALFQAEDYVKIDILYNTEREVGSAYTEHFDESLSQTFEYYSLFNTTIGINFYRIKFNQFSGSVATSSSWIDNIGIYVNGSSLNENSFGYAEVLYDNLEFLESSILFDGYFHVGTTYPINFQKGYIIDDDDLDQLFGLGHWMELLDLGLCKDSLVFTLNAYVYTGKTIELIGFQDNIKLIENVNTSYYGSIERGSNVSIYSKYDVVDNRLEGYSESEGLTNEWISIEFDIDDFLTTNYSFIINNMYKTNWLFNTVFTMTFTDGTQFVYSMVSSNPFEITGNQFVSDFGTQLSKYKYIDTFKFNISSSTESEGTNILSGINSMKLHCNSLGFIDLEDLHDSGILAIMIPLILLIFPTFVISSIAESKREGSGKKIFIPFFLIMATILFASAIIPTWIYFIIVLGFGALLILKKRLSND